MKDHTESQKQMILNDLLLGIKLTGLDILKNYGCIKASNRISELCAEGHPIQKKMIEVETPHGKKRVCEYWIEPEPKPKVTVDFFGQTAMFI